MLRFQNQQGAVPLPILVAVVFVAIFITAASMGSYKNALLSSIFPESKTFAASPYNPGDTDGDLNVGVFDYNNLLSNFGQAYPNADFDGTNKVETFDYNTVVSNFSRKYSANPSGGSTGLTMIEGVAVCTDHDKTKWHSLVKKDSSGKILCTYGHEHHDDPNSVNDIFGPPGAWYGNSGQSISYPWQTWKGSSDALVPTPVDQSILENSIKHEGYKWYVYRDAACKPSQPAPNDGCVIAWRVQVHSRGDIADANTRFHSFSVEELVEYHGTRAIVRHGGHFDSGHLALAYNQEKYYACPPLANNTATFKCQTAGPGRRHSGTNLPPVPGQPELGTGANMYLAGWYPNHSITGVTLGVEEWGPVDYNNTTEQLFHTLQGANNSKASIGIISADLRSYTGLQPDPDGLIRQSTYTNRHGIITTGCTTPGADCVPLIVDGASPQFHGSVAGIIAPIIEHDVMSPVTNKSLIVFPN